MGLTGKGHPSRRGHLTPLLEPHEEPSDLLLPLGSMTESLQTFNLEWMKAPDGTWFGNFFGCTCGDEGLKTEESKIVETNEPSGPKSVPRESTFHVFLKIEESHNYYITLHHPRSFTPHAMELHTRVPADLWCVTFSEFLGFVEDVRFAWSMGEIPNSPVFPDAWHEDSNHGPNLYLVNEHFVKPRTRAAGGMSYALSLHPEGLPCQVFVSHAWVEGIIELALGVECAWPGGRGLRNMYICLLANPQNLDMEHFLNVDVLQSPFAKALARASHILVVPNTKISIYSRLWCVYEAYLGITKGKICLMPATPHFHRSRKSFLRLLALPAIVSLVLTFAWRFLLIPFVGDDGVLQVLLASLFLSLVSAASALVPPQWTTFVRVLLASHLVIICLAGATCLPWWSIQYNASWGATAGFLHFFIPCVIVIFNIICISHLNLQLLEIQQLTDQANNLSHQTVQQAQCTNEADEARIRSAISGSEDDVDVAIRVLMLAGAYTQTLRDAYESGEDIRGAGILNLKAKATIGALIWCLAGLDSCTRLTQMGIARAKIDHHWVYLSVFSAFLVAGVLPLWLRCSNESPDWMRQTVTLWFFCGIGALLLPYLIALLQGVDELKNVSILQRMGFESLHEPSLLTAVGETSSVPFFAFVSLTGAFIGSKVDACRRGPYRQTRRLVNMASRTLSSLGSSCGGREDLDDYWSESSELSSSDSECPSTQSSGNQ